MGLEICNCQKKISTLQKKFLTAINSFLNLCEKLIYTLDNNYYKTNHTVFEL
jgi:hypothetical protein